MKVKHTAAEALAEHLGALVPELNTQAVQAPPHGISKYPALAVLPERFRVVEHSSTADLFDKDGEPVVDETATYQQVGYLRGSMQVWLAAQYAAKREDLEGAVIQAFMAGEVPGRILLDINTAIVSGAAPLKQPVAFCLENEVWREEFAFSERRWAILRVEVDLPIRVAQTDAPIVQQYLLDLTEDLTDVSAAGTPEDALDLLDEVEGFEVAIDGSATGVP